MYATGLLFLISLLFSLNPQHTWGQLLASFSYASFSYLEVPDLLEKHLILNKHLFLETCSVC